jgi:hypothetical protein
MVGAQLGPLGTVATITIVPASGDYDDAEIGGMTNKGNRSTRIEPAPVPLCPPQIPHAARTQTRASAVGSFIRNSHLSVLWVRISLLVLATYRRVCGSHYSSACGIGYLIG